MLLGRVASGIASLMSAGAHDALNSPGYNPAKLSGERLEKMKALAEKARTTYPPKLPSGTYEGPVSTPEGDRILELGRWANANRKPAPRDSGSTGKFGPGWPTAKELDEELGGADGFFTLCGLHYCNLFANPRMFVLFASDADSQSCAMDHGKRIAATLLDETLGTRYFASLGRGMSGAFTVMGTHAKAKQCPFRPASQQVALPSGHRKANRRFTADQRDSWVGSHMSAAAECGASEAFQHKYGLWLAMLVSAYAPFVDERTGKLDWMEATPY
jgi:hypothetical protein